MFCISSFLFPEYINLHFSFFELVNGFFFFKTDQKGTFLQISIVLNPPKNHPKKNSGAQQSKCPLSEPLLVTCAPTAPSPGCLIPKCSGLRPGKTNHLPFALPGRNFKKFVLIKDKQDRGKGRQCTRYITVWIYKTWV